MKEANPGHLAVFCACAIVFSTTALHADPVLELKSSPEQTQGRFGWAVSGIADINGDNHPDVIVGAPYEALSPSPAASGRAHLVDGKTGQILHTMKKGGEQANDRFGASVSSIPDVNNDSISDAIIGIPYDGASDYGRVNIHSGATGLLLQLAVSPIGGDANARYGYSVAGIRNLGGSGIHGMAVGSPYENPTPGNSDAGRIFTYEVQDGGGFVSVTLQRTLISPNDEANGHFGFSVGSVPDADGDNRDDIIVGAPGEDPGASPLDAGRAYIYSANPLALFLHVLESPNEVNNGSFGIAVDGIPDVDGDGRGDVIVGAPGESAPQSGSGRAYIFSGATGAYLYTLASLNPQGNGNFGGSVAGIQDINGDGRGDVLVGAYREGVNFLGEAGRVYVFSGATGQHLKTILPSSPESLAHFGQSVGSLPDAVATGRSKVLVGVPQENGYCSICFPPGPVTDAGRAYVMTLFDDDNDGVPNDLDKCPNTVTGSPVDPDGCPPVIPGDCDIDGDVDPDDFSAFLACVTGPTIAYPSSKCSDKDFDFDGDIDQVDFNAFQRCYSGTDIPAQPNCWP